MEQWEPCCHDTANSQIFSDAIAETKPRFLSRGAVYTACFRAPAEPLVSCIRGNEIIEFCVVLDL